MKKVNVFWILSLVLFLFYSCANDKNGNDKLLTKLVEKTEDGSSFTTLFSYKGNEIVSSDNANEHVDYTYVNGLITKIITKNKSNQSAVTVDYNYQKEQLVSVKSSDNYRIDFVHNSDGTVAYERFSLDSNNQETKLYHGVLSLKNDNLVKDKRTVDGTQVGVVTTEDVSFEYDSKKNPMHAILGFDKLLNQNQLVSVNNSLISVVESTTTNAADQIISSAKFYKSTFKYDTDDYPTERFAETAKSGSLKSQYFY
ncbi:hypothetical protein QO200_10405 [Flavobacterium sp. Arc3]|jgi:hypothetical protein|uniref:hypothetical protein n=1 Tax=unclassified Flavobacterium TaxID=196869 RepID=UPI00352FAA58